jgi:8-oxo-dGTP diphosphatase
MGASEQGADAVEGRWLALPRTLSFVFNGDDILLMKRGAHKRVFPNRYNGLGGHIERYEDPLSSAAREIHEESGLTVRDLRLRAVYSVDAGASAGIILFVFTAFSDSRVVSANDEGTLHWVPRDTLLTLDLVDDLPLILPRILGADTSNEVIFAHLSYDDQDKLVMRFTEQS